MNWSNLSVAQFILGPGHVAKKDEPLFLEGLRVRFLPVGEYVPQRVSRGMMDWFPIYRDRYVISRGLEVSLQVSELFWAVLKHSRVGTLYAGTHELPRV